MDIKTIKQSHKALMQGGGFRAWNLGNASMAWTVYTKAEVDDLIIREGIGNPRCEIEVSGDFDEGEFDYEFYDFQGWNILPNEPDMLYCEPHTALSPQSIRAMANMGGLWIRREFRHEGDLFAWTLFRLP